MRCFAFAPVSRLVPTGIPLPGQKVQRRRTAGQLNCDSAVPFSSQTSRRSSRRNFNELAQHKLALEEHDKAEQVLAETTETTAVDLRAQKLINAATSQQAKGETADQRASEATNGGGIPWTKKIWTALVPLLLAALATAYLAIRAPSDIKEKALKDAVSKLVDKIGRLEEPEYHVLRSDLEEELGKLFSDPAPQAYTVIVGARGVGKSEAVRAAAVARGQRGVLCVLLSNEHSLVEDLILTAVGLECSKSIEAVDDLLRRAKSQLPGNQLPSIVLEIEAGTSAEVIYKAMHPIKELVTARKLCNAFVVLSDLKSIFALPSDTGRQNVITVDDLSIPEANELLDKRGYLVSEPAKRSELFEKIGTRPQWLAALSCKGDDADKYISALYDAAEYDLNRLVKGPGEGNWDTKVKAAALLLVRKLVEKGKPVPSSELTDVSTDSVMKFMQRLGCHPIEYFRPTKSFRFHSVPVQRVAEAQHVAAQRAAEAQHVAAQRAAEAQHKKKWFFQRWL